MVSLQGQHLLHPELERLNKICGNIINYKHTRITPQLLRKYCTYVDEPVIERIDYVRGMKHTDTMLVWPPLADADIAVLRLRITNIVDYLEPTTIQALKHMDYVTAANSMIYSLVFPEEFRMLVSIGVFANRSTLIAFGKRVTPIIKRIVTDELARQPFVEINSLAGYQQVEPEGWDMKKEVEELAYGGNEHGLIGTDANAEFRKALDAITPGVEYSPKYRTFYDYIDSGDWMTSGSSSIGSVNWSHGDTKGHFKCRKNMLFAYYTTQELVDYALEGEPRLMSRAFVKPELAKRRIAIASDMKSYLLDSYIFDQAGHNYKNYSYVTLEESVDTEQARIKKVSGMLSGGAWALPFDFAGFDRQPTEFEIESIYAHVVRRVDRKVEPYVHRALAAYRNSYISYVDRDGEHKVRTKGGLPSGVKPTSIIGNVWNAAIMHMAVSVLRIVMGNNTDIAIWVRGDDAKILSYSVAVLAMFRLVLAALNAVGSNSKFGISPGHVEFLRNNITKNTQRGWVCRTIPGMVQRKPWNSEPWKPAGDTETLFNRIAAIRRRSGQEVKQLERLVIRRFTRIARMDSRWLSVPVRAGGFGLLKDRGWRATEVLPTLTRPQISCEVSKPYPVPDWLEGTDALRYSQSVVSSLIVVDDVPGTGKLMRKNYTDLMRAVKPKWYKVTIPFVSQTNLYLDLNSKLEKQPAPQLTSSKTKSTLLQFLTEYNIARTYQKLPTLSKLLDFYFPHPYALVKQWTRRGWHMTDAINIVLGNQPIEPRFSYHPILNRYAKDHLWKTYRPQRWKSRNDISTLLSVTSDLVAGAICATKLYSYYLF